MAQEVVTLAAAMLIGDAVETIDVNEDVSGFPNAGILLIGSEAFTYAAKNDSLKRFTGVSRAQKGTAAAGHSASADVEWIQHDVWMVYGNAAATAPSVDSNYEPVFNLTSYNTSWNYAYFGEDGLGRPGAWAKAFESGNVYFDTGDPWAKANVTVDNSVWDTKYGTGYMYIRNACGIHAALFTDGYTYETLVGRGWISGSIISSDGIIESVEAPVVAPTIDATPQSWGGMYFLSSGAIEVGIRLEVSFDGTPVASTAYLEAGVVVVTLGANTPAITVNAEQNNYLLAATITNEETGESILLTYTTGLNETLQVNTDLKTVTDLENGSNQFRAVDPVGGTRLHWLRMPTGDNVFRFDDVGTAGVTIGVEWEERRYS
ncbi:hypothetical protein DRO03_07235 [Methanosarcinales archaeon]|nr:MAG: hypothetical protein DRO03_07235 [Methanosarcinales archaeon]